MNQKTLHEESNSIENLLNGKDISRIIRNNESEICIEFSDKTRFFINAKNEGKLSFSITGGNT